MDGYSYTTARHVNISILYSIICLILIYLNFVFVTSLYRSFSACTVVMFGFF